MFQCVYCDSKQFSEHSHINGYELDKCLSCSLLQTRVHDRSRRDFIDNQYDNAYAIERRQDQLKLDRRFSKHLSLITRLKRTGRLLDVGCGVGYFLKYFYKAHPDWKLFGVEPSSILREVANENVNIKVNYGILNKIPYKGNFFDVVTCYDVLEHSTNIKSNLAELKRVLKREGILLVQAPNYQSLMAYLTGSKWDWWGVPDHVIHFSHHTLCKILEDNGFKVIISYTYDDQEDYISNLKGVFSKSLLTKILYYFCIPILIVFERVSWGLNKGGLSVVLVKKV